MKIFEGTKVETACKAAYNNMRDPFPEMLGTAEESEVYTSIWPDLSTYLNEMFTAFVIGTESLDNFDKYVETANSMGMQDIIEIKKAQYGRYQEIVGNQFLFFLIACRNFRYKVPEPAGYEKE